MGTPSQRSCCRRHKARHLGSHSGCFQSPPGPQQEPGRTPSPAVTSRGAVFCAGAWMRTHVPFLVTQRLPCWLFTEQSVRGNCARTYRRTHLSRTPHCPRPHPAEVRGPPGGWACRAGRPGPRAVRRHLCEMHAGSVVQSSRGAGAREPPAGLAPPETRRAPSRGGWQRGHP